MAWQQTGAKPLPEPMMTYCQMVPQSNILQWNLNKKNKTKRKNIVIVMNMKMLFVKWNPFCSCLNVFFFPERFNCQYIDWKNIKSLVHI